MSWPWPPDRPEWEPLETGLESSTVKLVETPPRIMSMDDAVKGPLRADLARSAADKARLEILENAAKHAGTAVAALAEAVAWFSVVDRRNHVDVVRQVELLAEMIDARLRNAGG